ncbi:hypothetical protein CWE09_03810 [Aliidiomarina minuta]|uniref:RanBP2-type domain-containing protein n=1 Tax=Aliidiomarina minuta TaxID=880057 RepID=A0A432W706_9GAMM|nr:DUF2007 domain-containing protein [Aliidiomarina minuta]RUO25864.1 hypothetical protein CWE09_03810 [Aliidiomarina minuta]
MQIQPDWKQVYSAANPMEAELLVGLLQHQGIQAGVRSQGMVGGIGELPLDALHTPVLVEPDEFQRARELMLNYESKQNQIDEWRCAHCGEENGANFEVCWQCGHSKGEREVDSE